ncbi:putative isochorismatase family protein [Lachnellula occidentalis]|uniref:Putative isochorismatase family protein n=1 Tax=Lachnellula occidentalis TaxID=215460 RepID=A0A8H8S7S1_9HELO|nr:putative isochorismatase family protein [Lachnellula occidentalis]
MAQSFRAILGAKPSTASIKDSVLVIIDAQNEYICQRPSQDRQHRFNRKAISTLLEKYRSASAPLVHIVHQTPAGAPVFTPDTDLAKEFAEIEPTSSEKVIGKENPGSFTGTDLDAYLKSTGRNKVVLVGYMAHVCVSTTARQAAEKGYDVLIAEEAVGDRDIPGASAADTVAMVLKELGDAFGTVVKADSIK